MPAIGRFLLHYTNSGAETGPARREFLDRVGRFVAARMVQTALELANVENGPGSGTVAAVRMALALSLRHDHLVDTLESTMSSAHSMA